MRRLIAIGLLASVTGCAGKDVRIVDGGAVDAEGWPVRPAEQEYRCPVGTDLVDDIASAGRRTVRCMSIANPLPRGFQLTWSEQGRLVSELLLTDDGVPTKRQQWFEDGSPSAKEIYEDGRLVRRESWYGNGEKKAEVAYDAREGLMIVARYQPDGSLEAEGRLKDGKRHGEWREWTDGALQTVKYVDDVPHGKVTRVYPDGSVERGEFESGRKIGTWTRVDSSGTPVREVNYSSNEQEGVSRAYHPNSQLREEGEWVDGERHGRWRTWHPSGELKTDRYYSCGTPVGPFENYYPSGKIQQTGAYEDGRKVGEWKTFNEQGTATQIESHAAPSSPFDESDLPDDCKPPT